MSFYQTFGKRIFDFVFATIGIFLCFVPALLVAFMVRIIDGSPILFAQQRVGWHGEVFKIYKFRTMRSGPGDGSTVTTATDDRITSLGRILRKWKLDELPQLINVLTGDMSFVGPRPDVVGYADLLTGEESRVLSIRPGITSPATLKFRDEESILAQAADPEKYNREVLYPEKVRLNLQYIESMCLTIDLKWILKTVLGK
jgi:lipopolysaccharide/colanic/teichoic acid biosynthesis glycosyltransferase